MFPYLDLAGLKLRTVLRPSYFDDVEALTPGYTVQRIASRSSSINSRLRKRYGSSNTLPFGQSAPPLIPSGVLPPAVTLTGRPVLGSFIMLLVIASTTTFNWSSDGGVTFTNGVGITPTVQLGTTGMSAIFPVGSYTVGQAYAAAPPVPETVLQWLDWMVTSDVATRHGINPNDPLAVRIEANAARAEAQLEEAANTQTGLFDLPTSEDAASAIDTGGPRGYSEQSPYAWTYRQQAAAQGRCGGCGCNPCICPPNRLVGG